AKEISRFSIWSAFDDVVLMRPHEARSVPEVFTPICQTSNVPCRMSNGIVKRPTDQLTQLGHWVIGSFDKFIRHSTLDVSHLTYRTGKNRGFAPQYNQRRLPKDLQPDRRFIEFLEHDLEFVHEVSAAFGTARFAVIRCGACA